MHIFLQGPRNIGKSTVIRKTLDILEAQRPLALGGFFTWNEMSAGTNIYMRPAGNGGEKEKFHIAGFDEGSGGLICDVQIFEQEGVRLLNESRDSELIIMDELGFLESNAPKFKQAVFNVILGNIPVFGVMRLGDVPWHAEIKRCPSVTLYDVNMENRSTLPQELAALLRSCSLYS